MDLSRDYNSEIDRFVPIVSQYNEKVRAYNTQRDFYRSLTDSYNKKHVGQDLTVTEYQKSLMIIRSISSEQLKLIQVKAELDQMTVTYNNEKQVMNNITARMIELTAKGANLMNS